MVILGLYNTIIFIATKVKLIEICLLDIKRFGKYNTVPFKDIGKKFHSAK